MDIAIIRIDKISNEIVFAGARRPIITIKNNKSKVFFIQFILKHYNFPML